ncbi:MAG TPA: hypothetical protein VLJ17_24590 [Xanthobacteraceae bacterium]|nr:hypothetical protein [Xanthobacteraceae bacterium]
MKTAIVTTTIRVPEVLRLYRKFMPHAGIFIAGDEKSPSAQIRALCDDLPGGWGFYYSLEQQRKSDWEVVKFLPCNSMLRRNIATLEAVKWGADIIYMIDDDNIPMSYDHSAAFTFLGSIGDPRKYNFSGLEIRSPLQWFDPNELLDPPTVQRGYPLRIRRITQQFTVHPVTDAKIGVVSGLILGSPDIDAVERIVTNPTRLNVSELARAGVVVNPHRCMTIFNSQNTAFVRELAPAMFMPLIDGEDTRYHDIFASLICQRIMETLDLYVHLGRPFVYQERNQHYLLDDLALEMDGMRGIEDFNTCLWQTTCPRENSVLANVKKIYDEFSCFSPDLTAAWIADCEKAMAG